MNRNNSIDSHWNAALYVRLSKEDKELQKDESISVTNQREILKEYLKLHPDIELYDTYIDDGYTGTDFERPGWKRLMDDIESGYVNCVIVKDLNRFGRNYTIGGDLIDNYFARKNIRFIALNNCIDTMGDGMNAAARCISIGVTNVINESYSAMTSVSIRGTLNHHRQQGLFIGSFPTYGYFKNPDDYHRLIIDETAAEVVRMIFNKYLDGRSILGITKDLNAMGVPNPTKYKQSLGWKFRTKADYNDGLWCDRTVRRILQNEIYIGNMVQGKNRTISYKVHVCRSVPKEEWYVVENTHEPIIDRKTFETVQIMLNRTSRSLPFKGCIDIFSGLLFCADCGKPMCKKTNRMPYGTYEYYRCSTKSKRGGCSNHTIRKDKLERAILVFLQTLIDINADKERIKQAFLINHNHTTKNSNQSTLIQSKVIERKKYENARLELYPDWKNGDISYEEYIDLKQAIEERIQLIDKDIENIKQAQNNLKSLRATSENVLLNKLQLFDRLSRSLLVNTIDRILVFEDNHIIIKTKCN